MSLAARGPNSSGNNGFNPVTFTGGASNGAAITTDNTGYGVNSPGNTGNNIVNDEAIVMSFDLSKLSLAPNQRLVWVRSSVLDPSANLAIHRHDGGPTSVEIYDGDAAGAPTDIPINKTILNGDRYAVFSVGNGQKRFRSMTFQIVEDAYATPPNIVMIMSDDMAWYDTPVRMDDRMMNSAQEIMRRMEQGGSRHPWNLQKISDQGMLFRSAYSAAPQCTPTRASLQTGQSTARNRVGVYLSDPSHRQEYDPSAEWANYPVIPNGIQLPFAPSVQTIPEILPAAYRCAHYGKWHLDSDPATEGYDDSDGNTGNDQGATYDTTNLQIPADIADPKQINGITNRAISFVSQQHADGHPFYVQLSHYAVHNPWECFPSSRTLFQNDTDVLAYNNGVNDPTLLNRKKDPAVYFGMIYDLDQSIGRLVRSLADLGVLGNTYIIFNSDNGDRGVDTQNFVQPFYGRKWFLWQNGIRVPMMIMGPGITSGAVSTANVVTYDLLPTFYEWAGGNPDDLTATDGVSLKGLLEGQTPTSDFLDRSLYFHYPHYRSALPMSAVVKGSYKMVYSYDATIRTDISVSDNKSLFDLACDPGEFHNLRTAEPALTTSLWSDLDAYLTSVAAWRPMNNSTAYLADNGAAFEGAGGDYRKRLDFAPFNDSRTATTGLNDSDLSPSGYWFKVWGVDLGDPNSDYDQDGISNLMEYALGMNPTLKDMSPTGLSSAVEGGNFVFRFPIRNQPGDVVYRAVTSSTLQSPWTESGVDWSEIRTGGDFNEVISSIPTTHPRGFMRLEVSKP